MKSNLSRTEIREKKILYLITQSELGGVQCYIFDLALNLGNEFNIMVGFGEQGEAGELAKKLKQANIAYYSIPHLQRAICPFKDFLALIKIIKLIKKVKPDIIHLNSSKISILGSLAFAFIRIFVYSRHSHYIRDIRIIYTVHGWVFNEPLPIWKKLFYQYAEKFTALFKDKIICVSEFDRQTALRKKITTNKKLITIHNGIKPINFYTKIEARQKLFTPYPKIPIQEYINIIIGTIGNLYQTKGFTYLVKAINILITNYQLPITTVIIGEGKERKKLENLIKQNNLENNIILTGRIDKAAQLLPAFDIYVCSSVKEGLSYTIIEAMQAGLPIVATMVGGNPELIQDNKTGLLVQAKNPEQLARKIKQFIDNPELRKKLGEQAKIQAKKNFSLEKMIKETKKVYLAK